MPRLSPGRAAAVLLAGAFALVVVVEAGTRAFVYDVSNLLKRMRVESRAAAELRTTVDEPRPLLLVGNSLLVAGVDVAALDVALRPERRAARFGIENTTYFDWFFGVRRLLGEGARPDAVVLVFEERHLLGDGIRDEIFARYLMQTRDILSVARVVDLSPTATSELFFARLSDFWGLRREIRKNLLGRLLPSLPALTALMTRGTPAPPVDNAAMLTTGAARLKALDSLTKPYGVRFVLALTPPLAPADADFMRKLGQQNGVIVLTPVTDSELQPGDYDRDGYHLSAQGRARYTGALANDLVAALPRP